MVAGRNIAAIAGMEAALRESIDALAITSPQVAKRRDRLVEALLRNIPDITLTGAPLGTRRLPSVASFAIKDVDAELLCVLLDKAGVAASTGSACSAGSPEPSHVIEAIGVHDPAWSHGTLRLSLADDVSDDDVDALIERIPPAVRTTRLMSGPTSLFETNRRKKKRPGFIIRVVLVRRSSARYESSLRPEDSIASSAASAEAAFSPLAKIYSLILGSVPEGRTMPLLPFARSNSTTFALGKPFTPSA